MRTMLVLFFNKDFLKYRILQRILMWKKYLYLVCCLLFAVCLSCYSEESLESTNSETLWTELEQSLENNEQELIWLNEQLQQRDTDLQNVQEQYQSLQQETEQLSKSYENSKKDSTKWKICFSITATVTILETAALLIMRINR